MFNPVRAYKKRLEIKRNVFNPDKKTLNLQALNRFVNGTTERERTKPTYLWAKTRKLLGHTINQDIDAGKYGEEQKQVADKLSAWCSSPDRASNAEVRKWLKLLAAPKPVERDGDEPAMDRSQTSSRLAINGGEDDARSHISSEDDAKSHRTSEEEFDWSAAFDGALSGIEFAIPNDSNVAESGAEDVGGSNRGSATIDSKLVAEDVSKRENVSKDMSNTLDNRGRRPAPRLRPQSDSTGPRHGVVHMVNGEVVPVKQ